MSMLTGLEIQRHVSLGNIVIDPFDPKRLNPNSYNLRLDDKLTVYRMPKTQHLYETYRMVGDGHGNLVRKYSHDPRATDRLDMQLDNKVAELTIPTDGFTLEPGILYLASTVECAGSDMFIPCIEGRSSIGRIGLCVHVTAGFGDLGFSGPGCPATWTLELTVVHPLQVYAGVEICQLAFTTPHHGSDLGPPTLYKGKYSGQRGPKPCGIWKEFF